MLNEFVDQIYCINLERRTDRKEIFLKKLTEEAETSTDNLTFIKAIDGTTIPNEDMAEEFHAGWPHYTKGAWGRAVSHINAVKDAKEKGYKKILIFEDDVTFINDFKTNYKLFYDNQPGEWDTLWLGANFVSRPRVLNDYVGSANSYAAHAYMLTEKTFDMITGWAINAPIDIFYCNSLQNEFRATTYHALPRICGQFKGYSDTEGRETNHEAVLGSI